MLKFNLHKPLMVLVLTAGVAACGSGGGSSDFGGGTGGTPNPPNPSATSDTPASALASVGGLIAFMNQLIDTGTNDTSEPIVLGDASLPVDDTI